MSKRIPYQPPQTSMERHLIEIVEHIRTGIDNRSGFAQKIEYAQEHAFWLESECARLRNEVNVLENELAIGLPRITMNWTDSDVPITAFTTIRTIEWVIPRICYRAALSGAQAEASKETWARIRKWTFRALVKELRKEYERCVPARLPEHVT